MGIFSTFVRGKKAGKGRLGLLLGGLGFFLVGGFGLAACLLSGCSGANNQSGSTSNNPTNLQNVKSTPEAVPEIPPRADFEMGVGTMASEKHIDSLFLSRDGKRVAVANVGSGSGEKSTRKIQIWDIADKPKKVKEYGGLLRLIAMSPDGTRIICRKSPLSGLQILDVETGKEIAELDLAFDHLKYQSNEVIWILPLPYHPNIAPSKLEVTKFDGNSGKHVGDFLISKEKKGYFARPVKDDLDFYFVTTSGKILVWDSTTQKTKHEIPLAFKAGEQLQLEAMSFAISSDGKWMISTIIVPGNNLRIARFDLSAGAVAKEIKSIFALSGFQFIPNRHVFLVSQSAGDGKSNVLAYDIAAEKMVGKFVGVENQYQSPVLSADGSAMAIASKNGKVQIWDLQQLK